MESQNRGNKKKYNSCHLFLSALTFLSFFSVQVFSSEEAISRKILRENTVKRAVFNSASEENKNAIPGEMLSTDINSIVQRNKTQFGFAILKTNLCLRGVREENGFYNLRCSENRENRWGFNVDISCFADILLDSLGSSELQKKIDRSQKILEALKGKSAVDNIIASTLTVWNGDVNKDKQRMEGFDVYESKEDVLNDFCYQKYMRPAYIDHEIEKNTKSDSWDFSHIWAGFLNSIGAAFVYSRPYFNGELVEDTSQYIHQEEESESAPLKCEN